MIINLNGRLVPEAAARISVLDRGFLYGDGLFESLRVARGQPFRLSQHLQRLRRGMAHLKLLAPWNDQELAQFARETVAANNLPEAVMRITLTRGVGPRGYSPKAANSPTLTMTLHPAQLIAPGELEHWKLHTAALRLPADYELAAYKTCNKLPQILARAEAEEHGADEALLLNTADFVTEGAASNIFWMNGASCGTPPLRAGALPGVTREIILELAAQRKWELIEQNLTRDQLYQQDAVFLTLSTIGVAAAVALDGQPLKLSPRVGQLHAAYWELVNRECR
jgi:aminodeoxychorismate lyase